MKDHVGKLLRAYIAVGISVLAAMTMCSSARAVQLAVPSYYNPGDSNYATLIAAGSKIAIDMVNIGNGEINPKDGVTYDPEPLGPWVTQSQKLSAAGAKVLFYCHSSYGARSLSLVEGDIQVGMSSGMTLNGIFVDECDTSWANTGSSYYTSLYNWIKSNYPGTMVVLNPGTIPDSANWMNICDILMDFESTYATYKGVFVPSWVNNYPATRFWHAVYSTPTTSSAVDACFSTAAANNAGYLFVTNLTAKQNTYGSIPNSTIWNEELKDATSSSGGTVPAAPTGLSATAGDTQVSLSWAASSGATSYNVYRGTASGGESSTPITTGLTGTTYTNTGLTNGTTYYYTVAAVNSAGTSGMSNEASATPVASTSTIYNETETVSGSNVTFTFNYTGSWTYFHIFLDTDLNASTGYQIGGIGANYMIENDSLYKSTSNSTTWSWSYAGSVTYSNSGGVATFTLPLSSIGSPSHMNVIYQVVSSSGSSYYNTSKFSY